MLIETEKALLGLSQFWIFLKINAQDGPLQGVLVRPFFASL